MGFPHPEFVHCKRLLTPEGWQESLRIGVSPQGTVATLKKGPPEEGDLSLGWVLPGMANLHSHAFQRAMVGRTGLSRLGDSFWSWREAMYRVALSISPQQFEDIAAWLYIEMLEAGYTRVAEFHYLHHQPDGRPYDDPSEMGMRLVAASELAGMDLCLLPTLYQRGGFGVEPQAQQRRFVSSDLEGFYAMLGDLDARIPGRWGVALHSLRAVEPTHVAEIVQTLTHHHPSIPLHIHIAEQPAEVESCLAALGTRPVQCLLDSVPLGPNWCLVHATHLDPEEIRGLAHSGAVVGFCPSTEADLGDGLGPAAQLLEAGASLGIGSDSQALVDPSAEIAWLEGGQRLANGRRNVLVPPGSALSCATGLWLHTAGAGQRACGQRQGLLASGAPLDLLELDDDHPKLLTHGRDSLVDAFVLGAAGSVRTVLSQGRLVVEGGRHPHREAALARFRSTMEALWSEA